jgi:signal transduction histidine kinase/FixJ family two-component response regulator
MAATFKSSQPPSLAFLNGGGEMGALIRSKDWLKTALGPPENWSEALKAVVSMVLANRFPQLLWWGPDYLSIYNDAYRPVLGDKHPWALGKPFREVWPEVAHILGPLIDTPFHGGPSSWTDDILLEVRRHGFDEETHFNFAYSPAPDASAPRGIGGVLATVSEITEKIVGERRLAALRDLGARAGEVRSVEAACERMTQALAAHVRDVPFAAIYLLDEEARRARLAGVAGAQAGDPVAPLVVELVAEQAAWPLAEAMASSLPLLVENLERRCARLPPGPWRDPPDAALIVPIMVARHLAGFLVAGLSPRLRFDEGYQAFFSLAAAQIATAVGNARAYEEERKRAEALAAIDRAKTTFFSNISHEFRTPLTLMLGPLEDALSDTEHFIDAVQRKRLEVAARNGLRLQKLVNSLLDFSRVEAGRTQANFQPTDLPAFTRDLASSFRSACDKAGLSLTIDTPPLAEPVFVDREMWEKIVLNLLSNAFKFTFEGGIEVTLSAEGPTANLTVRDTGVGIPKEEQSRIFERFHRVAGARGRTHEGTGIGLALVQELVKQHKGRIEVESCPEKGTTFSVQVPVGSDHLPKDQLDTRQDLQSTATHAGAFVAEALRWLPGTTESRSFAASLVPASEPQPSILLADDNADMREYLSKLLSPRYLVRVATDGVEALAAIRASKVDIVLADIMMPGLDGFELLSAIRADPGLADLPVVLLSARAGEEATIEGLNAGADDYLVKPFSARELLARLSANLERARARRQLHESEDRFRALVSATTDVVYEMSPDWTEMRALQGRGFLADAHAPSRNWIESYLPAEDQPQILPAIAEAIRSRSPFQLEHRVHRADGHVGWVLSRAVPLLDERGEITGWFGTASDVTERKQMEEHLRLVVHELNHRVKSNLAMIQAIASQTFRGQNDVEAVKKAFSSRLMALARAHDFLTGERWVGASLHHVLEQALEPYCLGQRERCDLEGPAVALSSNTALSIALAFHELATNAVKYGAWSNASGKVSVSWTIEPHESGPRLHLQWKEMGGPLVSKPTRRGFGSQLIQRGLAGEMGGKVELDFRPEGLACVMDAPITAPEAE